MLAQRSQGLQVLLVDDDDSLRGALVRMIRMAGFDVQGFGSVDALVAAGLPERNACMVLDVDLPAIRCIEFKQSIAAAGRDLPTIFITALEPAEVRELVAAFPHIAVLQKPFSKEDLLGAIGHAATQN